MPQLDTWTVISLLILVCALALDLDRKFGRGAAKHDDHPERPAAQPAGDD